MDLNVAVGVEASQPIAIGDVRPGANRAAVQDDIALHIGDDLDPAPLHRAGAVDPDHRVVGLHRGDPLLDANVAGEDPGLVDANVLRPTEARVGGNHNRGGQVRGRQLDLGPAEAAGSERIPASVAASSNTRPRKPIRTRAGDGLRAGYRPVSSAGGVSAESIRAIPGGGRKKRRDAGL